MAQILANSLRNQTILSQCKEALHVVTEFLFVSAIFLFLLCYPASEIFPVLECKRLHTLLYHGSERLLTKDRDCIRTTVQNTSYSLHLIGGRCYVILRENLGVNDNIVEGSCSIITLL